MTRLAVAAIAACVCAAGLYWGTFSVGGSDSACYVYQADLWASGRQRAVNPVALRAPWPDAPATLAPLGHTASKAVRGAIAPVCPAGLSIVMAPFVALGGRSAAFIVVPLFGALLAVATYLFGRRFSPRIGLAASAVACCSPIFLFQLMQPMTDVPAAALWTLAAALATGERRRDVAWAGLATSAALFIRPNLLLMGVPLGLFALLRPGRLWRMRAGDAAAYAVACVPGCVAVLAVHRYFNGTPLESGYGPLSSIFSIDNVGANAIRYARWLVTTHTPVVVLGIVAPFATVRRVPAWLALGLIAANAVSYLPYIVFDEWWYLRFLLPSIPVLIVLTVVVFDRIGTIMGRRVAQGAAPWVEPAALTVVSIVLAAIFIVNARAGLAFQVKRLEARFIRGGTYVAQRLPPNAFLLTIWHSGSVRYYAGRDALIWDLLDPQWLEPALAWLTSQGYEPYLMFESWEEPRFRDRFAVVSPIGRLDWPPMVEIARQVRIYRPADRARYFANGAVQTEYAK